jgi:hypothetical protein
MPEEKKTLIPGILLILFGIFLLFRTDTFIEQERSVFVTVLMIVFALLLLLEAFRRQRKGALFWGVFLLVFAGFRILDSMTISYTGDLFHQENALPFAFGIGFLAIFVVNPRDWGLLIPSCIFLFLGIGLMLVDLPFGQWELETLIESYWPVPVIFLGAGLLWSAWHYDRT